jgi:hypothetical protein
MEFTDGFLTNVESLECHTDSMEKITLCYQAILLCSCQHFLDCIHFMQSGWNLKFPGTIGQSLEVVSKIFLINTDWVPFGLAFFGHFERQFPGKTSP